MGPPEGDERPSARPTGAARVRRSRRRTTAAALAIVVGAALAALAAASATDRAAGPWVEALLAVGVAVLVATVGFVVVEVVTGMVLRLAAFVLAPDQPPGLVRLARMIEQYEADAGERAGRPPGRGSVTAGDWK